jgi:hypothetical protein
VEFDAETMESKVRALSFDGQQDVFDPVSIAIAFADTSRPDPLTGFKEFAVAINVCGVRSGESVAGGRGR